jgi:two-component sensor histidine kinase/PAS domain-containing protein
MVLWCHANRDSKSDNVQPPDYTFDAKRLLALDGYDIVDTPDEAGFDDIVLLAAQICDVPVALVSFVGRDRQWFKARVGFEPCETNLESSVCAHALIEPDLLIIPDLTQDERTSANPLVTGEPYIRFYAGAPLRTAAGDVIGSLCVIDGKPRPDGLTQAQASALRSLSGQVMSQLELRRAIGERDRAMVLQQTDELRREESERQYKTLFDAITDGFCIVEMKFDGSLPADYRFVEINPAFAQQTGLEDARGKWMRDLAPDHEQHWFDLYGGVAMTGQPVRFEQFAAQLGGRWYDVHAFPVGNPALHQVGILFNDVTDRKSTELLRKQVEQQQEVLNKELSHRMKNTFAMVQAIASQTLRRVSDREPVEAFTQRIQALSTAHDVLVKQNWAATNMDIVVRSVLATLAEKDRFVITGPGIGLGARATLALSLLLHELTTNAVKYGALSNEDGRVSVDWRLDVIDGTEELTLAWRETGGPVVTEPSQKGFGSRLIRMGLIGTGGVELCYQPQGFSAEFKAPLAQLQEAENPGN